MFNYPEGRLPEPETEVEEGNVYCSKNTHKTYAWVVLKITGNSAHLLGIDREGEISTTQSYGVHALRGRKLMGRVDLSKLQFDIEAI